MIFDRLFNSLQYRLRREEREWRATNQLRRELALTPIQKILLAFVRKPVFLGSCILSFILLFSLLSALIESHRWVLITIEKFHVQDPSAYFMNLWSIQAAIAALVYPIVIAFVTVLLQLSNNAKADLHIYLHDSTAVPSGLNALLLIVAMGLQYLGLPYVPKEVVFFWAALDSMWFVFNLSLTIRFLLRTFDFILPSKRNEIVRHYAINIAWPAETRAHLAKHLFFSSCIDGLLPGPHYGKSKESVPSVLPGNYGFDRGEPEVSVFIIRAKQLKDIRFRLLSWVIARWKNRAGKSQEGGLFLLPLVPLEVYDGDVVLCAIRSKVKLSKFEKLLVRFAFVFGKPKPQGPIELSIANIFQGIQGSVRTALRINQLDRYESELERMRDIYRSLLKASEVKDLDNKTMSMAEISDRDQVFGRPVFEQWSRCFLDLYPDAIKKLDEEPRYIDLLAYTPNQLFSTAIGLSSAELPKHFLLLSHLLLRRIEDWWSDTAERLGYTDHSFTNSMVLPAPSSRNHEKALIKFVGAWQDFSSHRFCIQLGKVSNWQDFKQPSSYFSSHIEYTVISLFVCLSRGDQNGAEWITDVLVKWYHQIEHRLPDTSYYILRHQKMLTIELCNFDWDKVQGLVGEKGEAFLDRVTPSAIFSSCLHNLWIDAICVTCYVLSGNCCVRGSESCLSADLISALIKGKSLRLGDDAIRSVHRLTDFNDLLLAILRQQFSIDETGNDYEKLLNRIVERINELSTPEMVSGRIYTGWGMSDLSSVTTGRLLCLMLSSKTDWKPDSFLRQLLNKWAISENEKIRDLKSTIEDWADRLKGKEFLEFEAGYTRIQDAVGTGLTFKAAKDALLAAIDTLKKVLEQEHREAVATLQIDQQKLRDIEQWSSSLAFSKENGGFPLYLFEDVQTTTDSLEENLLRIQQMERGDFTSPPCATPVANEEDWFAKTLRSHIAARVLWKALTGLKAENKETPTADAYWLEVKRYTEAVRAQGLTPILFLENPTIPEWVWEWQNSQYGDAFGEAPPDLVVTQEQARGGNAYVCNLNGIPVYSGPIQVGGSILLVKESLKKIDFRKFSDGIFIQANIDELEENKEKIDLVLKWEMKVEVILHPTVRLTYGKTDKNDG